MDTPAATQRERTGEVLAALRRKLELNQTELARRLELSQAYISKLEAGGVNFSNMPLTTVQKLAQVLRFDMDDWPDILEGRMPKNRAAGKAAVQETKLEPLYQGHREMAVFALQGLADPHAEPVEYIPVRVRPDDHPDLTRAALVNNSDMERLGRSIHQDDIVLLRTDQTTPKPDNIYAVLHQGTVIIRRFIETPLGNAFVADNPALSGQLIPPDSVSVLGHVYRVYSDYNNIGN